MPRPRCKRRIRHNPSVTVFKPQGVPAKSLQTLVLSADGAEALRLKDVEGLDQTAGAERMGISQSTFQRILSEARRTVSKALLTGTALRIGDKIEDVS